MLTCNVLSCIIPVHDVPMAWLHVAPCKTLLSIFSALQVMHEWGLQLASHRLTPHDAGHAAAPADSLSSACMQDAAFEVPYTMQQMQLYMKYARAYKPELTPLVRAGVDEPPLWRGIIMLYLSQ